MILTISAFLKHAPGLTMSCIMHIACTGADHVMHYAYSIAYTVITTYFIIIALYPTVSSLLLRRHVLLIARQPTYMGKEGYKCSGGRFRHPYPDRVPGRPGPRSLNRVLDRGVHTINSKHFRKLFIKVYKSS